MMNYWKSVKATFWNWLEENQRLGFVLLGAILLPLMLCIGLGLIFVFASILMFLGLSSAMAILLTVLIIIGGIGGLLTYMWLDENE
jgi:hypothetical protein